MNWFRTDDAFYYFQTARNISNGLGPTFDGINLSNGFHPLWMLVCIPVFSLANFDLFLPFRILILVLGILNAASTVVIFRWLSRVLSKPIGMMGAIIWAFAPPIHSLTSEGGLETGLSVFIIILLISQISNFDQRERSTKNVLILGLIASLAFLARLDNIFLILFLGIWVVIPQKQLRNYLVIDANIVFFSAYLSLLLRLGEAFDLFVFSTGIYFFIILGLLAKIPVYFIFRLYQQDESKSITKLITKITISVFITQLIIGIPILILTTIASWFSFPRSVLIIDMVISFSLIFLSRSFVLLKNKQSINIGETPLNFYRNHWKTWARHILYYYGVLTTTICGYLLLNKIVFNTFTPISGQIKQWWGNFMTIYGSSAKTIPEALGLSIRHWDLMINPFMNTLNDFPSQVIGSLIIISIVGFFFLIFRNRKALIFHTDALIILPILSGSLWQIWTYNLRSYIGLRDWYWISQNLLIFLMLLLFIQLFLSTFSNPNIQRIIAVGSIVFLSIWIGSKYLSRISQLTDYSHADGRESGYLFGVSFLEENTEPGSIIGMTGGGTTAYFLKDRTIVNLDGLINSVEYFHALRYHEVSSFLKGINLQYVFAIPYVINESSPYNVEYPSLLLQIGNHKSYSLFRVQNP
ncbi:hypothetical protein ACFLTX_01010 [Chloroflexota bacterium]